MVFFSGYTGKKPSVFLVSGRLFCYIFLYYVLMSKLIKLKNITEVSPKQIAALANNRAVSRNLRDAFPYPYSEADGIAFLELCKAGVAGHNYGIFNEDNVFVGTCGIIPKKDIYRLTAEIGYWIGQPYWSRGYATQTVQQLAEIAFNDLKLVRLYAEVFGCNRASMRVLEKAGFKLDAVLKKNMIKEGQIMDSYLYSRVAE